MKKLIIASILFLTLLHFSECTLLTKFEHYEIEEKWAQKEERSDDLWVYVSIYPTKKRHTVIPGIYDNDVYRDPYRGFFTIWGHFDSIEKVESYFVLNENNKMRLPIDVGAMNRNKKNGPDGTPYFPSGKIPINLKWNEIKTLKLITIFSVIIDGVTKTYEIENHYEPTSHEEIGNRFLFALSSV